MPPRKPSRLPARAALAAARSRPAEQPEPANWPKRRAPSASPRRAACCQLEPHPVAGPRRGAVPPRRARSRGLRPSRARLARVLGSSTVRRRQFDALALERLRQLGPPFGIASAACQRSSGTLPGRGRLGPQLLLQLAYRQARAPASRSETPAEPFNVKRVAASWAQCEGPLAWNGDSPFGSRRMMALPTHSLSFRPAQGIAPRAIVRSTWLSAVGAAWKDPAGPQYARRFPRPRPQRPVLNAEPAGHRIKAGIRKRQPIG